MPTPAETELAALARIKAAIEEHDLPGLAATLITERANLRPDGRALSQINNLLVLLDKAPTAFNREHEKLDAELNPPAPPPSMPVPGGGEGGEEDPE